MNYTVQKQTGVQQCHETGGWWRIDHLSVNSPSLKREKYSKEEAFIAKLLREFLRTVSFDLLQKDGEVGVGKQLRPGHRRVQVEPLVPDLSDGVPMVLVVAYKRTLLPATQQDTIKACVTANLSSHFPTPFGHLRKASNNLPTKRETSSCTLATCPNDYKPDSLAFYLALTKARVLLRSLHNLSILLK